MMIKKFNDFNPKIYFAHPKSTYGKPIESECIQIIREEFSNCEIINPADYQETFKKYRSENSDYMKFFNDLISSCDKLVYLPFRDGMVGFGIIYEIDCIDPNEIYEIDVDTKKITKVEINEVKSRGLNFEETSERNKKMDF